MSSEKALVHAPFNFVPLSTKVQRLPAADRVSRDVPFRDGICGELELELEATTPLCVGGEREGGVVMPFATSDGTLAIPGTSVKGMIRSVLEIVTFSKMQFVDRDRHYAVRDLNNRELYMNHMTNDRGGRVYEPKPRSGWLKRENGSWTIEPCSVARVEQADLLEYVGKETEAGRALLKCFTSRSSMPEKYEAFAKSGRSLGVRFSTSGEKAHSMSQNSGKLWFALAEKLGQGDSEGTLIFSGQASANQRMKLPTVNKGKHREFIFHSSSDQKLDVPPGVARDFEANHSAQQAERREGTGKPNNEWGHWKAKLEGGERVPIFYLINPNGEVSSIGLTQMYRLAYKRSLGDAIDNTSIDHAPAAGSRVVDFADGIFGYVAAKEGDDSARGRADFSLFRCNTTPSLEGPFQEVLNGPKPTYYPSYIEQNVGVRPSLSSKAYTTLMDDRAELRGWKRYPARGKAEARAAGKQSADKVSSQWRAVPARATFTGKLRIHNLRPFELGAILWSLDFGGRRELRHKLGYAKPFGFGDVRLAVKPVKKEQLVSNDGSAVDIETCRKEFERVMNTEIPTWSETEQLVQLRAMSNPSEAAGRDLSYMVLDGSTNDFRDAKKADHVLPPYASFSGASDRELFGRKPAADQSAALERDAKHANDQREKRKEAARRAELPVLERVRENFSSMVDADLAGLLNREWTVPAEEPDQEAWIAAVVDILAKPLAEMRRIHESGGLEERRKIEALLESLPDNKANQKKRKTQQKKLAKWDSQQATKAARHAERCGRLLAWLDGGYREGPLSSE